MTVGKEKNNIDNATVAGFGDEWSRFDQNGLSHEVRKQIFDDYFSIFPWSALPENSLGVDVGCGSGRWAAVVAPRVGQLLLLDASGDALAVARKNLTDVPNVRFDQASVGSLPIDDASLDFAYSLGVLHHVPDTAAAIRCISEKLKSGAPFLVYLYYSFDNRGVVYRVIWKASDIVRRLVSRMPFGLRYWASQALALSIYWPLARIALLLGRIGKCPDNWPLAYYKDKPFYVLRTDALDRFGTRLEQRFSRVEIMTMLEDAGFKDIRFSDGQPYWCAVGIKS
jgi:ubiquinone/menaquinone biosynthesis C-methylase UbiE